MDSQDSMENLIEAVYDGKFIDWDAERAKPIGADAARGLDALHLLARIRDANHSQQLGAHRDLPFQRWRHLRLLERVAHGTHGELYRAWDEALGLPIALKLFPETDDPVVNTIVLSEARALARVQHENVVRVLGADFDHSRVGYWMEFLEGATLAELVEERGSFSSLDATRAGLAIARALAATHAAGIVHGDVKAANVLRTSSGRVCLLDFSVAHTTAEKLPGRAWVAGTPYYMAPELLRGEAPTPASDVYALGILLFFLLTGRHPIETSDLESLRSAHRAREERSLLAGVTGFPRTITTFVDTCLHEHSANRPKTMEAIRTLERIQNSLDPRKRRQRRIAWAAGIATILGAGAAASIIARWIAAGATDPQTLFVGPFQVTAELPQAEMLGSAFARAVVQNLQASTSLRVVTIAADSNGAGHTVDGKLAYSDDRVHVRALLRDRSDQHVKLVEFEQPSRQLSEAARQTALLVAQALHAAMPRLYEYMPSARGSPELNAAEDYLEYGRKWQQGEEVLTSSQRLVERFPTDPAAHYLKLWAVALHWSSMRDDPSWQLLQDTMRAVDAVDPANPYTLAIRSFVQLIATGELRECYENLQSLATRSDLSPSCHAWILRLMAQAARGRGQSDVALRDIERSLLLEPTNASGSYIAAEILIDLGRCSEAVDKARLAKAQFPTNLFWLIGVGNALRCAGRLEEAIEEYRDACEASNQQFPCALAATAMAAAGRDNDATHFANFASKCRESPDGAYALSRYWALTGRADQAIATLTRAIELGAVEPRIAREPDFDRLRADPRFEPLVARMRERMN